MIWGARKPHGENASSNPSESSSEKTARLIREALIKEEVAAFSSPKEAATKESGEPASAPSSVTTNPEVVAESGVPEEEPMERGEPEKPTCVVVPPEPSEADAIDLYTDGEGLRAEAAALEEPLGNGKTH